MDLETSTVHNSKVFLCDLVTFRTKVFISTHNYLTVPVAVKAIFFDIS